MSETKTNQSDGQRRRIVLVTGLSGAGKATALKALEDIGFDAVDNPPFALLDDLLTDRQIARLAVGIDVRTHGFDVATLLAVKHRAVEHGDAEVTMVYLECDDDTMISRFTETRRRHPLSDGGTAREGVAAERRMLAPLRAEADRVLDTSLMLPRELKRWIAGGFEPAGPSGMTVQVISFSFREGLPREADMVFDVRFLANPHYVPELQPLTGLDAAVGEHVDKDPGTATLMGQLEQFMEFALPRYEQEGKSYLTVAVGCTGGRHRSVYIAERIKAMLERQGWAASVTHRELGIG